MDAASGEPHARRKDIMDVNSFKTISAKPAEVERTWFVIDAENQIVGRLASQVATLLRGKHKPSFTPHVDTGDFVIVVNADKVRFSGNKENDKLYYRLRRRSSRAPGRRRYARRSRAGRPRSPAAGAPRRSRG